MTKPFLPCRLARLPCCVPRDKVPESPCPTFQSKNPFFCTILPVPDYLSPPSGLAGPQLCAHRMLTPTHFRKVKFSTISQLTTHVPLSNHMQKPQGDCVPLSLAHNSPPARLESLMTDPYHKNYSASRYQLFQHAM